MAEPEKQQFGENCGQAAGQLAKAVGQIGREAAKHTAAAAAGGSKAAAEIAAGSAAGPAGTLLSALWSLRHLLFRVLAFAGLFLLVLVMLLSSLPDLLFEGLSAPGATPQSVYGELAEAVSEAVDAGRRRSLARVEELIAEGGYEESLSMEALTDASRSAAGYDVYTILAAYEISMGPRNKDKEDMRQKLLLCAGEMFPVTWEEREEYVSDTETMTCLACTIHPFDRSVISRAVGIDLEENRGRIESMAAALRKTLDGTDGEGQPIPLTDRELRAFPERQVCSETRKRLLTTALSLVGKVPYFWGGKSGPGWNSQWNTSRLVTAEGSASTGTILPYGMDCSGFSAWVYETALGADIGCGTWGQYPNTEAVPIDELLPGDLGFLRKADGSGWEHVLLFAGYDESGERLWVHCTFGSGVTLNRPGYENELYFRRLRIDLED